MKRIYLTDLGDINPEMLPLALSLDTVALRMSKMEGMYKAELINPAVQVAQFAPTPLLAMGKLFLYLAQGAHDGSIPALECGVSANAMPPAPEGEDWLDGLPEDWDVFGEEGGV